MVTYFYKLKKCIKNLNCGAAASSEPHRNVFADLHKKKKSVFTCEN